MYGKLKKTEDLFKRSDNTYEKISYSYFNPECLNKGYIIKNPEIYLLSEQAIKAITELNADSKNLKNLSVFLRMIIRHEAVKSSFMEGTKTTFNEILLPREKTVDIEKINDREEVDNYIEATFLMRRMLSKLPISERFINDLHKILLNSVRGHDKNPGAFRKVQNWIGGETVRSASFIPPHPNEIDFLMKDLCEFWHNDDIKLPALVKIALFHYQFETIHPFCDGNGRIGRLLILAQLLDTKLLDKPWFNVSNIFEKNKINYTESLKRANVTGNLDQWIIFFLDSIISAAQSTYKIYHDYNELQKLCDEKIISLGAKMPNAKLLLDKLYKSPFITVKEASSVLKVTRQTSNNLLNDFVNLEIIVPMEAYVMGEKIVKKQKGFFFEKYANIFNSIN